MQIKRSLTSYANTANYQKGWKIRYDWVVKVIQWDLWKKFRFDIAIKWHMHNPESVLQYETPKILWDFETETDYLI